VKYIHKIRAHNTPDSVLIADVKKTARKLRQATLTKAQYEDHGTYNPSTLVKRFGTWFTVLRLAGLEKSRSSLYVAQADLFENLKRVWRKLGRQPLPREMRKPLSAYCLATYKNRFGSWGKALARFIAEIRRTGAGKIETVIARRYNKPPRSRRKRTPHAQLRLNILTRDNFRCQDCGNSPAFTPGLILHVDHIKAWARGGETIPKNLQTRCDRCNYKKSNRDLPKM
jgi:hypothetical protein